MRGLPPEHQRRTGEPEGTATFTDFDGETYVSFSDLCGFKELMGDQQRAYEALNRLYNKTYELLTSSDYISLRALAVSDCVISWAHHGATDEEMLCSISALAKDLHTRMLAQRYLMRTAIAYGDFKYEPRIEPTRLRKDLLLGKAYLDAYVGSDEAEPGAIVLLEANGASPPQRGFWRQCQKPKGWEYFWAAQTQQDVARLMEERRRCHDARFRCLIQTYQDFVGPARAEDQR